MGIGVFDVAVAGDDEQHLRKQAVLDTVEAATYDVRARHGAWLFGAHDLDGFNDRAKLAYVSICNTIEPHTHARRGVYRKVMKTLEREWRERQAADPSQPGGGMLPVPMADATSQHDTGTGAFNPAVPGHLGTEPGPLHAGGRRQAADYNYNRGLPPGMTQRDAEERHLYAPEKPVEEPIGHNPTSNPFHQGRHYQACWPGCHENEAHAKKFHKDKKDSDEKEARRRQAVPSTQWDADGDYEPAGGIQDPDRAHQILDRTHEVADEHNQRHHQIVDRAHEKVDERTPVDPYAQQGLPNEYHGGPEGTVLHYPDATNIDGQQTQFHDPSLIEQQFNDPRFGSRRYADDGAYAEHAPDHPEMHNSVTFQSHQGEELIPEGNWDGYRNRVDQGAPGKVNHDFIPGEHDQRHNESGDNFITGSEYQRIARMMLADVPPMAAPGAGASPSVAPAMAAPPTPDGGGGGMGAMGSTSTSTPPAGGGATPPAQPMNPMMASREYQIVSAMTKGSSWARRVIQEAGTKKARQRLLDVVDRSGLISPADYRSISAMIQFKTADRNYLQQADEALTKVLNEKATEFQNTIAPLQQALVTIQQAEALTNPLNVSPPAGTVNVMPGQQGAAAAPQGGGGMGASPAAAGLAGQPAAPGTVASKRGGRGKA